MSQLACAPSVGKTETPLAALFLEDESHGHPSAGPRLTSSAFRADVPQFSLTRTRRADRAQSARIRLTLQSLRRYMLRRPHIAPSYSRSSHRR